MTNGCAHVKQRIAAKLQQKKTKHDQELTAWSVLDATTKAISITAPSS
jgi:hypothetical protein